ncbi:hypothetical protein KC332_g10044 [Hortaea werneckii]|nr:hypothetical protein KC358_g7408 [Hortaea werneckii]KAI6833751.1 hypothetical protein KC350_g6891 [Hortaea werneckii]KAI6929402.1 hypothetical protein KC348_g7862 [Hortaea werneckii]KAI6933429.1 hypothetical protein KC341_g8311 [Hortaea werneckii]KAI6969591.1 hypothetical protein KC321_g7802 [Hortaea werneckii]
MTTRPDNTNHLLALYTRISNSPTSHALFNFPPTSHPSPSDLRTAYKHLALALHPDKAPPGREELHTALFQRVTAAFEDLQHPKEAAKEPPHAAEGKDGGGKVSVPLLEDSLHARVHDFREWLKVQRSAELEKRRKVGKTARRGKRLGGFAAARDHGHGVGSEGWQEEEDVVLEGKEESFLAGSNACVARLTQVQREEKRQSRFVEGAGSKIRAEKRLDRLFASGAIPTREYERAWMALEGMSEVEGEVPGFVEQEPELCEMLGIRAPDPESEQRLISNTVAAEELSEGVAANLGLLLVEVAPSKSGHQGPRRGKKAQAVESWEEEEDRLSASVDEALIPRDDL